MDALTALANRLRMAITRGAITLAKFTAVRTTVQVNVLDNETLSNIELMLPMGMSAIPKGGDVVIFQVLGTRSHLVALCADDSSLRITDLVAGEFGFRDQNAQQVVFRHDRLEVTTPLKLVANITADCDLTVGGNVNINATGNVVVTSPSVQLGGAGGKKVALDGDPIVSGVIVASSTNTKAT